MYTCINKTIKTMKTKHTKGEWAWQLFGDTYMLTAQHGIREIIIGAIPHGEMNYPVVAMTNEKTGRLEDVDPIHPNAKLIAAAPELLESVQELCNALLEIKGKGGVKKLWAFNSAQEAIKKATE